MINLRLQVQRPGRLAQLEPRAMHWNGHGIHWHQRHNRLSIHGHPATSMSTNQHDCRMRLERNRAIELAHDVRMWFHPKYFANDIVIYVPGYLGQRWSARRSCWQFVLVWPQLLVRLRHVEQRVLQPGLAQIVWSASLRMGRSMVHKHMVTQRPLRDQHPNEHNCSCCRLAFEQPNCIRSLVTRAHHPTRFRPKRKQSKGNVTR